MKGRWGRLVVGLGLLCYGLTPAQAVTLDVCPSGCTYSTIQSAIDDAVGGVDDVLVGDGTYVENIDFLGKAIIVQSVNGATTTIIDGGASGSVVTFNSGEGAGSALDGFTIQNGSADSGGGIVCWNFSSPTITNCTISNNSPNTLGGGIHCRNSSPKITNCTISNNAATSGGGIYCGNSSPKITNCTISGNTAREGGGIFCSFSSPTITNCSISNNSVNMLGGGIYCYSSLPTITNCTISSNSARDGGGICSSSSSATVVNSILWGDSPDEIYLAYGGSINITYSDIEGGWVGVGNINTNPLFVGGGNYHLQSGSPCIDTGRGGGDIPADDIDGDTRPWGAGYDMGSDEYVLPAPSRLRVRAISRRKIRLRWRDNSNNEDGFKIERKRRRCRSRKPWVEIATVPADTTRYVNRGLRPDTKYSYRLRAYNAQGDSGYSNCRAVKTLP